MITVHIWYPENTPLDSPVGWLIDEPYPLPIPNRPAPRVRWGHAGMELIDVVSESGVPYDDCYRAFWPGVGADWLRPSPGRIVVDRSYDESQEGTLPSRSITIPAGLNEALIYRYWTSLMRAPLDYENTGFNCCGAVATAVRDGFPIEFSRRAPAYPPLSWAGGYVPNTYSNPYALEDWVDDIVAMVRDMPVPAPAAP